MATKRRLTAEEKWRKLRSYIKGTPGLTGQQVLNVMSVVSKMTVLSKPQPRSRRKA